MGHSVLGGSLVDDLLLENRGLGESEGDLLVGQSLVGVGDGVELVLNEVSVEGVEENELLLSALNAHSGLSAGDVGGEDLSN